MEVALVVLGIVALALGAGCVWLGVQRGALMAQAAAASARAEGAESERRRVEALLVDRDARIGALSQQVDAQSVDLTRLAGELDAGEQRHIAELRRQQDILDEQRRSIEQRERTFREEIEKREREMRNAFRALSAEALSQGAQDFLKLAQEKLTAQQRVHESELDRRKQAVEMLVKPLAETLGKTDAKLAQIEKGWAGDKAQLVEGLRAMQSASEALRAETTRLSRSLRDPHVRGRYGELQLKRVAELAGMSEYCDFATQEHTLDTEGNASRPDMVVRLPNQRVVVVDAKTNIQAYLDAGLTDNPEEAEQHLDRFANHVARQAVDLAKKKYWALPDYAGSPEFVVMFMPADAFLDAALSRRPDLLDMAASHNVLLATPATLIALLRAVAVGYQEQRLAKAAEELRGLGRELHERAAVAFQHLTGLGDSLERAVRKYNEFVGSYETRLEPTLRKFEDAGVKSSKELPEGKHVEIKPRTSQGVLDGM